MRRESLQTLTTEEEEKKNTLSPSCLCVFFDNGYFRAAAAPVMFGERRWEVF